MRESGSESGKDKNSSEGEKESANDEHDVDNANCADSETVEITEKENKEVRSECDVTEKPNRGPIDENECVEGSDSEGVVNNEAMEIEVQDKSEVVEVLLEKWLEKLKLFTQKMIVKNIVTQVQMNQNKNKFHIQEH